MISDNEALEIATRHLHEEYQASDTSMTIAARSIELKDEDEGLMMMGWAGKFYAVTFHCNHQSNAFDPDYIILLVDAETGEPFWYPGEH